MYKLAPGVLCGCVSRQNDAGVTNGTVSNNCKVAHRRTSSRQTAFSIKGSQLWNALPANLKQISGPRIHNKAVKKWLKDCKSCTHSS